jgi:hypothetical protein
MQIMQAAAGAAVLSLLIAGSSGSAVAQSDPSVPKQSDLASAQREINEMSQIASDAALNGNCARKSIYINRLWEIYQNENNPFWTRHHLNTFARSTTTGLAQISTDIREKVEKLNGMRCPGPQIRFGEDIERLLLPSRPTIPVDPYSLNVPPQRLAAPGKTEVNIATGGIKLSMPKRSFLGSESGGVPRTGLFAPDRETSGASVYGSVKFDMGSIFSAPSNFGGSSSTWAKAGFYYASLDNDQSIGTIDAGPGNRLLIPGPTGGASGFSIAPGNPAQNVLYSNNLSKSGGRVDVGQSTHFPISVTVDFWGSLGYSHYSFDEKFSGTTAGFNFAYNSDAKVDQFRMRFGVGLSKDFPLQSGLTFNVGAYGEVGPDFSRGSGTDSLSFTTFPTSSTNPSTSQTAAGYRVGVTAGIKTAYGFGLSIEGAYMRETGLPVFDRDGTNSTRLELSSGDAWTVMGRGTLRF